MRSKEWVITTLLSDISLKTKGKLMDNYCVDGGGNCESCFFASLNPLSTECLRKTNLEKIITDLCLEHREKTINKLIDGQ